MKGQSKLWSILIPIFFLLTLAGSFSDEVRHSLAAAEEVGGSWTIVNIENAFGNQSGTPENSSGSQIVPIDQIANASGNLLQLVSDSGGGGGQNNSQGEFNATDSGEGWNVVPIEDVVSGNETPSREAPNINVSDNGKGNNKGACERLGLENAYCSEKEETLLIQNIANKELSLGTVYINYTETVKTKDKIELKKINTKLLFQNVTEVTMKDSSFRGDGGTIYFRELKIHSVKEQRDISPALTIQQNLIGVDTSTYPDLDQPAHIEFYNIHGIRNAYPLRNGEPCGAYCSNFTYDPGTGIASMEVSGFSNYSVEGVNVTSVLHLASDYTFISDITEYVKDHDDNWSEQIPVGDFVRATFEQNLSNGRVIDVYARKGGASNVYFNVYKNGTTSPLLGTSEALDSTGGWQYITLENLTGEADTFDFKIMGDSGGYAEFDYIHDAGVGSCQAITSAGDYWLTSDLSGAPTSAAPTIAKACIVIGGENILLDCNGHKISNNGTSNSYGIFLNASAKNATLRNCSSILNYTYGVGTYGTSSDPAEEIVISNVTVINNSKYGFYMNYAKNVTISGSTAMGNYSQNESDNIAGFYLLSSYNNTIENSSAYGNTVDFYLKISENNTLFNNDAYDAYDSGIYLTSANGNNLTGNRVYNNTAHDNTRGIYLYSSSNKNNLFNNTAYSNSQGLRLDSSSSNNLSNNTLYNNFYGFYLYSSTKNTFTNNTAYNNSYGFFLYYDSNYNSIFNNTAYNNTHGFHFVSSSNYNNLSNNTAYDNSFGFSIRDSSSNNLSNNTAYGNTLGFYIYQYAYGNNLFNNTAYGNTEGFHIDLGSYNNALFNDSAYGNTLGFSIESSSYNNNLYNNSAHDNNIGFSIESSSSNNALFNNTAYSNSYYGFHLYDYSSRNNLSDNSAYNNSGGFRLESSDYNTFSNNTAYNNSEGFHIESSDYNNLFNNTAFNNLEYGFNIDMSNATNLADCRAYNNTYGELRAMTDSITRTFYASNLTIDNPYGNMQNYTVLNITDNMQNEDYLIGWVAHASGLP